MTDSGGARRAPDAVVGGPGQPDGAGPAGSGGRLLAVDATRGFAMVGVLLAHFAGTLRSGHPELANLLARVAHFASPTFVLVSGAMLGYLLSDTPGLARRAKGVMVDRAFALLTFGHLLIALAHVRSFRAAGEFLGYVPMTDAIAVAILVGVVVIPRTGPSQRLGLALALYATGWGVALGWTPSAEAGVVLRRILVGEPGSWDRAPVQFVLVQWTAVFLVGSLAGGAIRSAAAGGSWGRLARRLLAAGAVAIGTAATAKLLYLVARPAAWASAREMPAPWFALYHLTTPFAKAPPGPVYLLAFGGAGLLLGGTCLWLVARGRLLPLLRWGAVIGRASLFVFVLQFYVFLVLLPFVPDAPTRWIPVEFAVLVAAFWAAAWAWNRWVGNRVLTVGLRPR